MPDAERLVDNDLEDEDDESSAQADDQRRHWLLPLGLAVLALSSLELEPDETAEQALERLFEQHLIEAYHGHIDELLEQYPDAANPFNLERQVWFADLAQQLARDRLQRYADRLQAFMAKNPTDAELADWLATRAANDPGIWARLDVLLMRRMADSDFYGRNRDLRQNQFTILPLTAAEPNCAAIVGLIYDSYDEAEAALMDATHPNCVHYIVPAS